MVSTPEKHAAARQYVREHWDTPSYLLEQQLGKSPSTIRLMRRELRMEDSTLVSPTAQRPSSVPAEEKVKEEPYFTPAEMKQIALEDRFVGTIAGAIDRLPPLEPYHTPTVSVRDEELCVLLSDLHIGENVDPVATGGLGAYNFDIFEERLQALITEIERTAKGVHYPRINWFILGDIVDGYDIYKGQAAHQDRHIADQVVLGARKVALAIAYISQFFDETVCYAVVGNHGRVGRKGEAPVLASFDYLAYVMMREYLAETENVRFHISDSWFQVVERGVSRFVLLHGDDIHAWNSIPYYGMERAERRYAKLLGMDTDFLCVGHFHTPVQTTSVLANGSFVGPTEFAKVIQAGSLPTQKMFSVSKDEGLLWVRDIALTTWKALRQVKVIRD